MAEYVQNEDGTLTLVHQTHQAYSEEWAKAQAEGCQGCLGVPAINQSDVTNKSKGVSDADQDQ